MKIDFVDHLNIPFRLHTNEVLQIAGEDSSFHTLFLIDRISFRRIYYAKTDIRTMDLLDSCTHMI